MFLVQKFKCPPVETSGIEGGEYSHEYGMGRLDLGKEGDAGTEFEIVRRSEDVAGRAFRMLQQGLAAFDQARTKDRMRQIRRSLIEPMERIKLGG